MQDRRAGNDGDALVVAEDFPVVYGETDGPRLSESQLVIQHGTGPGIYGIALWHCSMASFLIGYDTEYTGLGWTFFGMDILPFLVFTTANHRPMEILHRRPREMLPRIRKIPHHTDQRKARKHGARIVHGAGIDGDGDGHAEQHDRQHDPAHGDQVDDVPEALAQREGRVAHGTSTAQHGDEDGEPVGGRETDGRDAREGVEGRAGSKVDQAEQAVDEGGEEDGVHGDVQLRVDFAPETEARDGAVAGEGVRAAAGSGESPRAGEQEDPQDEEEQAEAATGRASDGGEDQPDGLAAGVVEQPLHRG